MCTLHCTPTGEAVSDADDDVCLFYDGFQCYDLSVTRNTEAATTAGDDDATYVGTDAGACVCMSDDMCVCMCDG